MKRLSWGILAAACAVAAGPAFTQDKWPQKPITYIVPFPPGGTTDILARIIAQKLGPALGTTIVVENKPGAGGNIGSDFVAKAKPDGYTILGGTISSHAINPSIYKTMPYDALKSFQPITLIGTNANVLVVGAGSPFKTVQDVIAAAKAKPGSISFASAGNGTSQHLSGELFKSLAGDPDGARAVQGQRPGDPGRDRRPCPDDVRHDGRRRATHPVGQGCARSR